MSSRPALGLEPNLRGLSVPDSLVQHAHVLHNPGESDSIAPYITADAGLHHLRQTGHSRL